MNRPWTLSQQVPAVLGLAAFTIGSAVIGYSSLHEAGRQSWAWAMLGGMAGVAALSLVALKLFPPRDDSAPVRKPPIVAIGVVCGLFVVATDRYVTPELIAAVTPGLLTFILTISSAGMLTMLREKRARDNATAD